MDTSRLTFFHFIKSNSFFLFYQESIQELYIQIDKLEADIEILSVSLKKKKSDKDVSIFNL